MGSTSSENDLTGCLDGVGARDVVCNKLVTPMD